MDRKRLTSILYKNKIVLILDFILIIIGFFLGGIITGILVIIFSSITLYRKYRTYLSSLGMILGIANISAVIIQFWIYSIYISNLDKRGFELFSLIPFIYMMGYQDILQLSILSMFYIKIFQIMLTQFLEYLTYTSGSISFFWMFNGIF